jgi:hypothetical protein
MTRILVLLLLFSQSVLAGEKMECYTKILPAMVCDGRVVQPNDASWSSIQHAPNPAYIVRACMSNEHAFPQFYPPGANGPSYGRWSMGVDRDSIYTNASGYPISQPVDPAVGISKMIGIGYLDIRPGADGLRCERHDPPVKFTEGQDRIILNFYCGGMVNTIPVVQVCWKVTE